MRERRIGLAIIAVMLLCLVARHPSADIRIATQDSSDPAPHHVQAAIDLGIVAVSLLWTWSDHHLLQSR